MSEQETHHDSCQRTNIKGDYPIIIWPHEGSASKKTSHHTSRDEVDVEALQHRDAIVAISAKRSARLLRPPPHFDEPGESASESAGTLPIGKLPEHPANSDCV
jgi:hypothetical protein